MTELYINNNINNLDNCDFLSITKLRINAPTYINKLLNKLDKFTNLQELYLYGNQISEIKGLDKLINLKELYLICNQITEIKGLDKLINLKELYLICNKITEIKGLNNLLDLQILDLNNNNINELPISLCNLKNICFISYYGNPIEYISSPVQKWLDKLSNTSYNMNYNDNQNIQNSL